MSFGFGGVRRCPRATRSQKPSSDFEMVEPGSHESTIPATVATATVMAMRVERENSMRNGQGN